MNALGSRVYVLLPVYRKYREHKIMLNDISETIYKIQNVGLSTG